MMFRYILPLYHLWQWVSLLAVAMHPIHKSSRSGEHKHKIRLLYHQKSSVVAMGCKLRVRELD